MKKFVTYSCFTIITLFFSLNTVYAQLVKVDTLFWVMSKNSDSRKSDTSFTNNAGLNLLFSQYGVSKYEKAIPFAKTPQLKEVYKISCQCNIDSLIDDIRKNFPDMYSGIKRLDYENIALYDPVDWMWTSHKDDWLWHLKKIQADLAWNITKGDSNIRTALIDTDFDINHPDLAGKIEPLFDPYDSIPFDCNPFHFHGTAVAGYVAGETTEIGNTPNGQLASVGFNTKMMCYKAWSGDYLLRALHASTVMGAKIITSSAGGWSNCPDNSGIDKLIVKEILDNGTTIIMPAGNGEGTHNFCSSIDSVNHSAFFPLSPYYDERIIIVTSSGIDDKHQFEINGTHSHYPDVDLCSPGYNTMSAKPSNCGAVDWPYFGSYSGTSFSTPIVAGIAALMYSINPCMTPSWCQDILKNTTDPILDAVNFPNGVGTGRVNAFKAVKAAQVAQSTELDLYIKDRPEDFGDEQFPYNWQADRDQSYDIWVRNQQDGYENQVSQQPEYQLSNPAYVYVKVRNKSCENASGNETLKLYWSKASSCSSWPQNWDGSQPNIGDVIGSINIGNLQAGRDSIYQFQWNIANPYIFQNWSTCLLARIENSQLDQITIYPERLDDDVYFNNNISMRNVIISDIHPGKMAPGTINGTYYPHGSFIYMGNASSQENLVDFKFSVSSDKAERSIFKEAEVKLIFDEQGWELMSSKLESNPNIKILAPKEILLLNDTVKIEDISFPANVRIPIYIGFSFLVDEISEIENYKFYVRQYLKSDNSLLGSVRFEINRYQRTPFSANAGSDKEILAGETVAISSIPINESAIYNWYDEDGLLIHEGIGFSISPEITSKYKLEVISNTDGFKDYDEMEVKVNPFWIENISPNPAQNYMSVEYKAESANSAYLMVMNETGTISQNYIINTTHTNILIDLSNYDSGNYTVILVCDGLARDAKHLVIQ